MDCAVAAAGAGHAPAPAGFPYPHPCPQVPLPTLPELIRALPGRRFRWADVEMRAHQADLGDYRIHWAEAGAGDQAVALVHGLSGSSYWWARNIAPLAAAHRVLLPDVIGFGRSRLGRRGALPPVPELAEVLSQWMALAAGEPAHLVGHSMGGQLAVHIAARFPGCVERLVLVDAAGIPRRLTPSYVARFAYEMVPPRRWGDPAFMPVIAADALTAGPATLVRALRGLLRDDVRPLLPQISTPTLLLWGRDDGIVPLLHAEEMRRVIPGARLLVLAGAAHNPMVDRAEDFNDAVLRFLRGEEVGE